MARDDDDADYMPEWVEVLGRAPIAVADGTTEDELAAEMAERLSALLKSENGLEPTAEGWRQLALKLALKYEPAFQIETPEDRTGDSGMGGRPVGMGNFVLRSRMKAQIRTGKTQAEAARAVAKESKGRITFKTANNALSRKSQAPDSLRRAPFEWKAERAMRAAAAKLSQESPPS